MTKQEIGSILMKLREQSGKSREEVAELLGKSVKTIGHWETGYAQPDANTLFLLCTIYDADLNSSFGFCSKQKSGANSVETELGKLSVLSNKDVGIEEFTGVKKEAWEMIQRMDDETLAKFIRAAKAMLGD